MCRCCSVPTAIAPTVEVKPPAEPVVRAASGLAPGRALDLACGTGRHAIWLHQHGWTVTAVDRDAEAIAQLQRDYPGIDTRVVDLETAFEIETAAYDLIVCWLYFQPDLYPRIAEAVRPGGIVALCALLQGRFAARPEELRRCFETWTVLHNAETELTTELVAMRG
jgi:SAM-dependent methyltransferase